jgi:hypothetical protein
MNNTNQTSPASVFLVTVNDGDYYTRYAETLGAFTDRNEALGFAFAAQAASFETFDEALEGLEVVEMNGGDVVASLSAVPSEGIVAEYEGATNFLVTDVAAAYRSLVRALSR